MCGEVVLRGTVTNDKEDKKNEQSQDHLDLEARDKKGVGG